MADKKKNTYSSKFKRIVLSVLPVSKNKTGECNNCGTCCKLPNICPFLRFKPNGNSYCSIHFIRPLNCRKYPRTNSEHITQDVCGFQFK